MKYKLQTFLKCYSYDLLERKSSGITLKTSVMTAYTEASVGSSHSNESKKTMAVKTPTKLTDTPKTNVSPKK